MPPPPPPLGYAENFFLYVNQLYKGFNNTINFVCVKTVQDSTKLYLIKGSKSKLPWGSMPLDPLVCHMLEHGYVLAPQKSIQSHFAPPSAKS